MHSGGSSRSRFTNTLPWRCHCSQRARLSNYKPQLLLQLTLPAALTDLVKGQNRA